MKAAALTLMLLGLGGCRCKSEPSTSSPVLDEELKALISARPKDGCSTFQVVEGPDGKKSLQCVQMFPSDAGR